MFRFNAIIYSNCTNIRRNIFNSDESCNFVTRSFNILVLRQFIAYIMYFLY